MIGGNQSGDMTVSSNLKTIDELIKLGEKSSVAPRMVIGVKGKFDGWSGAMNNRFAPYTMDDVSRQSSKELFTVISTFAGGGGSSTGYKLAGGKVLAENEFVQKQ